ncbi:glycoside hydrolase superfamily [Crucibulum laeve]|uniref:Glycoside hydrolase superfamily n=1 Tax=Crucibulum laeve TaxID=68775 RepID=A0A5C3LL23_9AGAR|nr:glycoside hydrolase superfamily [Crucibulum laeve]
MPAVPSISPTTGNPTPAHYIHTTEFNFVDNAGRTLLLRGVNLSGASKAPVGRPSYILEDFWECAEDGGESFVGRPLNIDDGTADVHLGRLKGWGYNMLRFPVTWEAIEHEGPGKYDEEYIDYTIRVLQKCKEYGFRVYMDPHQDTRAMFQLVHRLQGKLQERRQSFVHVDNLLLLLRRPFAKRTTMTHYASTSPFMVGRWSRFSGGSGAPFWTLPACGINPYNITATQAAIIHSEYPLAHQPDPASLPAMVWSTNYGRLLSQTVFTLFFAGRDFAPECIIDDMNIQDWLQNHYIEAMGHLADRIREFDGGSLLEECVIGWDSLNEPFEGLCGWEDLNLTPVKQGSTLKKGTYPTPAQSLRLGMGQAQTVDNWSFGVFGPSRDGTVTIDPKGRKVWADVAEDQDGEQPDGRHPKWGWKRDVTKWPLGKCIWALHGVWDVETGYILRPDYFRFKSDGDEVEFISDYWKPHWSTFTKRIRRAHPEAIMFVQPPVFAPPPRIEEEELKGRCAYSGHYYDGLTLVTRHWNWFNADALGLLRGKYSSTLQAVKIGTGAIRKSLQEQLGMLQSDVRILGSYPTVIGEIGTPMDMDGKRSYGWTDGGKYKGDYEQQERALDASLNGCDGPNSLNYTIWTYCPDDHTHEWGDGWNMEDLSIWSPDDLRARSHIGGPGQEMTSRSTLDLPEGMYEARESQAVLLRKKGGTNSIQPGESLMMRAAASSLSLATLGAASLITGTKAFKLNRPSGSNGKDAEEGAAIRAGWHSNPYDFLTDGARAVRAFSRPWPTKVVGLPSDIKFEISKAYFKLVVSVRPEDKLKEGGLGGRILDRSSLKGGTRVDVASAYDSDSEEEPLATEIYVPLVHYAHPRLLTPKKLRESSGRIRADSDQRSVNSVSDSNSIRDNASSSTVDPPTPPESESSDATALNTPQIPAQCCRHAPREVVGNDLVDVDVKVSAGRWSIEGQTLKWWYDVPAQGTPPNEYTIEIRRKGGIIKTKDYIPATYCEQFCPTGESCVVM